MAEPREGKYAHLTPELNEDARRNARFTYAQRRIQKIVDGAPPLTKEQLAKLAVLLHGGGGE